jgi:hypothetical protein
MWYRFDQRKLGALMGLDKYKEVNSSDAVDAVVKLYVAAV